MSCKILDLIHQTLSDFSVHPMGRALPARRSRFWQTRAALAPAKPVLRILDRIDPLAELAAMG
jgi:hypothetical protein